MPALIPTDHYGTIVWLGRVVDREATLRAEPLAEAIADLTGIEGEAHAGLTRPSCSRVAGLYPRGTEIRNTRQLSIVAAEDLEAIARTMGLDRIEPAWIGASIIVSGIPDFAFIPPSSRLQGPSGVTITVDMENRPCIYPGEEIEQEAPGKGKGFKAAAKNKRGVTAWIERGGRLAIGDRLRLHVPDQRAWAP